MFTGQEFFEYGKSRVAYYTGLQPTEYLEFLRDSICLLDRAVSAARTHPGASGDKERSASLNMSLGFGLLAMSEARSALMLLSIRLERSARIHLRALHEYVLRTELMQDAKTARAFKIAAAEETRKYAEWLGSSPENVANARATYLGDLGPDEQPTSEKAALGGNMQNLMRKHSGGDKEYALWFGFPSLFSHGSVLALNEVAESIDGCKEDFAEVAFRDELGSVALLNAGMQVLKLTDLLLDPFGVNLAQELDAMGPRMTELAKKLPMKEQILINLEEMRRRRARLRGR